MYVPATQLVAGGCAACLTCGVNTRAHWAAWCGAWLQVNGERVLSVGSSGVLIRRAGRSDDGTLTLEGPLSEEYWRIRDCVYGQYSIA